MGAVPVGTACPPVVLVAEAVGAGAVLEAVGIGAVLEAVGTGAELVAEAVAVGVAPAMRFTRAASSSLALVTAFAHGGGAVAGSVSLATRS